MKQSEQATIDAAIDHLKHFKRRFEMYVGRADVDRTTVFLSGFALGLAACGIRFVDDAWWKAQADRGWEKAPSGPVGQMEAKGMDATAIVSELVEIEILKLRRYTERAA